MAALRKAGADLVVVLAHGTQAAAVEVAGLEGVDLVLPAHQGSSGAPRQAAPDRGFVLGSGYEGRAVLQIDLTLGHPGPLVDGSAADRARRELGGMQGALGNAERLHAEAKTAEERELRGRTLEAYRKRVAELKAVAATQPTGAANTFYSRSRVLGQTAPDDEVWAEKLRRVEEKYPSRH